MKVTNDQLEALLRQQSQTSSTSRTQSADGTSFEAALTEQLGLENAVATSALSTSTTSQTSQASQASMISQMLLGSTTQTESTNTDEDVIQSAFDQASGTLDMWDSYVNALGSSGQSGSLRDAYSLLQGIDGQVSTLKTNTAAVRGQNEGLDSLVNELDVMTATEKFKFNRGDYNS